MTGGPRSWRNRRPNVDLVRLVTGAGHKSRDYGNPPAEGRPARVTWHQAAAQADFSSRRG
jgi:hypothetical protein